MPWKNPLQNLTRKLHGKKVLKCKQCGACCPKNCRHLILVKEKTECKINARVQKNEFHYCGDPPEIQYKRFHPMIQGFIENKKRVFNCKAMQETIDSIFGKKTYNVELKPGNKERNKFAFRIVEKIQELLKAKNKTDFENKKQELRFLLEEMKQAG